MLNSDETNRLKKALLATVAIPVVGSIEDYTWEAIFHYVKNISLNDPALGRKKLLHDAVDIKSQVGWSLKTLQVNNLNVGSSFSYVIQRADIFKKASLLGFDTLTVSSDESLLGEALVKHWNNKLSLDRQEQNVIKSYEVILLKNIQATEYAFVEYPIDLLNPNDFIWSWTTTKNGQRGAGLQGKINGELFLTWYRNQKQLFKRRIIPNNSIRLSVSRTRLDFDEYVNSIIHSLEEKLQNLPNDEGNNVL